MVSSFIQYYYRSSKYELVIMQMRANTTGQNNTALGYVSLQK